jgi:hypothetical protein
LILARRRSVRGACPISSKQAHVMADPEEAWRSTGRSGQVHAATGCLAAFEPVLAEAVTFLGGSRASLYVYGSVANGTVRPGSSDVDLLSVGLPAPAVLGQRLSARYADLRRGVKVAAATAADWSASTAARGRQTGRALCRAGANVSPASPSRLTGSCPGPRQSAAPIPGKSGTHSPTTASSPGRRALRPPDRAVGRSPSPPVDRPSRFAGQNRVFCAHHVGATASIHSTPDSAIGRWDEFVVSLHSGVGWPWPSSADRVIRRRLDQDPSDRLRRTS